MFKGGYKIIDMGNIPIDTSTGTMFPGIYEKIEGNNGKPILFENVVIGETEFPSATFITPLLSGTDFVFSAYGYIVTVDDDDAVTVVEEELPEATETTAGVVKKAGYVNPAAESAISDLVTALIAAGIMSDDT